MSGFKRTKDRVLHNFVFFIIVVFTRITGLKSMLKAETYSEPCETSKMEHFAKRVKS